MTARGAETLLVWAALLAGCLAVYAELWRLVGEGVRLLR